MYTQGLSAGNCLSIRSEWDECPICFDPFQQHPSRMVITACRHNYHETCLSRWVRENASCPECRQSPTPVSDKAGNVIENFELYYGSNCYLSNILKANDTTALEEILKTDPELVNRSIKDNASQVTCSLLAIAASCSDPEIVDMLINANANVDQVDHNGRTPLMYAIINNQVDNVKLLLENTQMINKQDAFGYTATILAGLQGNLEILRALYEKGGDIHATTHDGANAFLYACQNGYLEIAKFLHDKGANIHVTTNKDKLSALYLAIQSGNVELVDSLLEWEVPVDKKISLDRTPLLLAADLGHAEMVRLLIRTNAKVNSASEGGMTPLYWAAYHGHKDIVTQLINAGANKKRGFKRCFFRTVDTPRNAALRNNHTDVADLLKV